MNDAIFHNKHLRWFIAACAILFCFFIVSAESEPSFPDLTGRVVDNANMLDRDSELRITDLLAAHERATSNQIVVVTVPDLDGYPIEMYGYQLGRAWGIGQKSKDNGVLLIVAEKERKIRIEVGYGLEGVLTDAISANIIHQIIVPEFKKGKFTSGIERGVRAIIDALGGEYKFTKSRKSKDIGLGGMFFFIIIALWFMIGIPVSGYYAGRGGNGAYGGYWGGGGFGGGSGGFGGGGGGFGGGGASGGW